MYKYTPDDIAKILTMDDHIEDFFPCDKGEWVQFLQSMVDNPGFLIIGTDKSYLVAVNNVQRPVSDQVFILMFYSDNDFESSIEIRDYVNAWAEECGTKKIRFIGKDIEVFEKYGAKQYGIIGGWDI